MSGSLLGFYMVSIASITAAPFTSMWVPVVVIGFMLVSISIFLIINIIRFGIHSRSLKRSLVQIDKIVGFAADYLRFRIFFTRSAIE